MAATRAPVLLVAPHPDDLAWSLGATVDRLGRAGVPLYAVTVFTWSRYAPGSPAHGSTAATGVRALEDADWAEHARLTLHRWDLPDCSLRGYTDDTEMGAPPDPEVVDHVADRLAGEVAELRPGLVLLPLAAGGHVDHCAVRAAGDQLRIPGTLWYEDLPYAAEPPGPAGTAGARPGTAPAGIAAGGADDRGEAVVVGDEDCWAATERGARCYPSQQPDLILPVIRAHRAATGGERLWTRTPAAADRLQHLLGRTGAPHSTTRLDPQP